MFFVAFWGYIAITLHSFSTFGRVLLNRIRVRLSTGPQNPGFHLNFFDFELLLELHFQLDSTEARSRAKVT